MTDAGCPFKALELKGLGPPRFEAAKRGFSRPKTKDQVRKNSLNITGRAPRIFFIFAPLLREEGQGGGGVQRGGGISLKSEEKGGKGGGGRRGRCRKRVGGIFGGEGCLIFILRVEEPP